MDPAHEVQELSSGAWRRELAVAYMTADVEMRIINPHRLAHPKRQAHQALAAAREERQSTLQDIHDAIDAGPAVNLRLSLEDQ
jgi:hypothetical protein